MNTEPDQKRIRGNLFMINKHISLDDKLNLIHKYYNDLWNVLNYENIMPHPPSVEKMKFNIVNAQFPGIAYLAMENLWHKARNYYFTLGDDNLEFGKMEGDVDLTEENGKMQRALSGVPSYKRTFALNEYAINNGCKINV